MRFKFNTFAIVYGQINVQRLNEMIFILAQTMISARESTHKHLQEMRVFEFQEF